MVDLLNQAALVPSESKITLLKQVRAGVLLDRRARAGARGALSKKTLGTALCPHSSTRHVPAAALGARCCSGPPAFNSHRSSVRQGHATPVSQGEKQSRSELKHQSKVTLPGAAFQLQTLSSQPSFPLCQGPVRWGRRADPGTGPRGSSAGEEASRGPWSSGRAFWKRGHEPRHGG